MTNFNELSEFSKEFKKLSKKYLSLPQDLGEFKKILNGFPLGTGKHFNILSQKGDIKIVKARLLCRYLKGSSLRVIYSFQEQKIEFIFIEIYSKNEKPNENFQRIKDFLNSLPD